MLDRRRLLAAGLAAPLLARPLLAGRPAAAQSAETWPDRPVKLIVGFAPGSGNDVIARLLGEVMGPILGQQVVVENKSGAGGMIGTEAVAKSKPDGYTIMLGTSSQLVMNLALYDKLSFDIRKDIAPVALISRTPLLLAVHPKLGVKTVSELVALAKSKPRALNYGDGGPGSISHIAAEVFLKAAGIEVEPVHYRGNGPAFQALLAGEIDMLFDGARTVEPYMKAGQVVPIAIGTRRSAVLPDVPTFEEAGLRNADCYTWNSIMVPAGTPQPIVTKLNAAVNKALAAPPVNDYLVKADVEILAGSTPESTGAFWEKEAALWVPTVRAMGVKLN